MLAINAAVAKVADAQSRAETMTQTEKDMVVREIQELEQRIRNQWAELRQTVSTFPEWAVFFKRMENATRAAGLHPDAPISKKMLRDSAGLDQN
jgi:hypothetical protein